MRPVTLFTLDTPYREPLRIKGVEFGSPDAEKCIAVVGSMRGNEIQQAFVCAELIKRLEAIENRGLVNESKRIIVVPSVNAFSMNIDKRFWPMDNTDINRMFPGYDAGETTQRIAAGLFEAVKDYEYGIQMCSFYLPGDFLAHVRVTDVGPISTESLALADRFGFPYVVKKEPSSFDTTTLNYNWQVWNTHAFSIYSKETDSLDMRSATFAEDCILRFMHDRGAVRFRMAGGSLATHIDEKDLVDVRTLASGGFFRPKVEAGQRVEEGQLLAEVIDTFDARVREALRSPVSGYVFFSHTAALINQYTIAFKIVPELM